MKKVYMVVWNMKKKVIWASEDTPEVVQKSSINFKQSQIKNFPVARKSMVISITEN